MKTPRSIFLLLASLPVWAQGLPKVEPRQVGFSADRLGRIHRVLQDSVERKEFAGINVAIARHGKLAWFDSAGYRDLESRKPLEPDTLFRIFSMTKPITSAAAMMLYEEGRFLLDDPVSKYIPGFEKLRVLATENGDPSETVALERPVTIRDLLTHTSGFSNDRAYRAAHVFSPDETLRQMIPKLLEIPLANQPETAWRYGQGLEVIAYLVELWSGKPYDEFLRERIFEPLGMRDTAYFVPEGKLDRVSRVYRLNANGTVEPAPVGGSPAHKPAYFAGSYGLYSTAGDYLRFCQMLLNGGELDGRRLLGKATVHYMMTSQVPLKMIPPEGPNGRTGYGFGIGGAVLLDPAAYQTLSFKGEFNWGGAAGTYFWIDPANDLTAVWMVQRPPFVPRPSKRFKVLTYQALEN